MGRNKYLGLVAMLFATISAEPAMAADYTLETTIAIPPTSANSQPGGAFTSFDISYFNSLGTYYLADRSNASVDIIDGASLSLIGRAGGFTGQQATTSVSGPDGVLAVTQGGTTTLFAGDGNSTLKTFNVTNPAAPTVLLPPINTDGNFRVDEMAYSPSKNLVLVANNADTPAFATLVNATTGMIVKNNITVPNSPATGGLEQPVWDPVTGTFFVSVPAFNGSADAGGIAEIDTSGTVVQNYDFTALGIMSCAPTGLALGASGHLLVGCGNPQTQAVLLDPTANGGSGLVVTKFPQISSTDEIWYDPTTANFFVTGADTAGNRVFDVINDASQLLTQTIMLPGPNPHRLRSIR